ncbi:nitric oxide reductase activation protein NorD [Ancylobacter lacus]|uniref:nitric oxide reductase activation protein NorD n=1 Tax=Ancylobacter lacus TaxID=2579970 RepID=UPI001BCF6C00|nr:VWA domain-containing protein [Ancylobacter lacus]MBS7540793.1 VWA domain-containing protein [Ancylobacter lacus]
MAAAMPEAAADTAAAMRLERQLGGRPELAARFATARGRVRRALGATVEDVWALRVRALYEVNAGPAVLAALYELEARLLPGAEAETVFALWDNARVLCRHAGARAALAALAAVGSGLPHGGTGTGEAARLAALAGLAARAPDAVMPLLEVFDELARTLDPAGLAGWIGDGLALHPTDRRRRAAYFRLIDPLARLRLAERAGAVRYAPHEERLRRLTRALFGFEPQVHLVAEPALSRTRLAGGLLLMPARFDGLGGADAARFFEAAMLHAAAHRAFTPALFAPAGMKPVQRALVALLEDARVERLAVARFPGLGRLWRGFHTVPASPAQTIPSLFARLARGLADPAYEDGDGWIVKARDLFERAFAREPQRQGFVTEIARILGHDLGQLRIPFDGRSYRVEPAYRDDGLGLFDQDEADPSATERLELTVEAARLRQEERETAFPDPPPEPPETTSARPRPAPPADEPGEILALYPEWHPALRADQPDHVTVRLYPAVTVTAAALEDRLQASRSVGARIGALVRRARLGRPDRLRRRLDGEEIDLEAAQDALQALRAGVMPDPRIHALKRRQGRDVALLLLLDVSQSTADPVPGEGETVLSTAALSVALLGQALDGLGDPFAALAFASNGRSDVRITPVKRFAERWTEALPRLAALRPAYSTRLGAAIRHGAAVLAPQASHRRVLVVVTDGEPSDIDVEEEGYLAADARRAVVQARGEGLDVFCVALGPAADRAGAAVFGRRNTFGVSRVAELPQRLAGLYFQLTVR